MKTTFFARGFFRLIALVLVLSASSRAAPPTGLPDRDERRHIEDADDEPDQLSWPFFADCQPIIRHFLDWSATNPPPQDAIVSDGAPDVAYPYTWIKAAALIMDNEQWRAESVDDTAVLRGPGSHNYQDQGRTEVVIPHDGRYRLWSRYYHRQGWHETFTLTVTAPPPTHIADGDISFRFHLLAKTFSKAHWRRGIDPIPVTTSLPTGFLWEGSDQMAFLKAGRYQLRFSGGIYDRRADPKISDLVFSTDPLYVPAETDIPVESISGEKPPCAELLQRWNHFAIRPGNRPLRSVPINLQTYWMAWRRALIDKLAVSEFTDYVWGNLAAMVYFDEESNLVGRPAEVQAQRERDAMPSTTFVIHGDQFQNTDLEQKSWGHSSFFAKAYPAPRNITGPSKDSDHAAFYEVEIPEAGRYVLWVHYFFIKGWALVALEADGRQVTEFEVSGPGRWKDSGLIDLPAGKTRIVLRRKADPPDAKPREYESPILNRFVLTQKVEFTPDREVEYPSGDRMGDGATGGWLSADPWAGFTRFTGAESLYYNQYAPYLRKPLEVDAINRETAEITARRGEVVSQLFMLRNNTDAPVTFSPELSGGKLPVSARLVAYTLPSNGRWSPMLLLRRRQITAPPKQNTAVWLTFDCRQVPEGTYPVEFKAHTHKISFSVRVKGSLDGAPILYTGVYASPYPRASSWEAFQDMGINMLFHEMISKAAMQKYGILHLASLPYKASSEASVRQTLAEAKKMGLENSDWSWYLIDEPGPSKYAPWLEMAERIRKVDPTMMIWCNLGEGAPKKDTLPTLLKMMDYWDVSCPYRTQFGVGSDDKDYAEYAAKLRSVGKIRMLYGTLDIGDHEKGLWAPLDILKVAEEAERNNRNGWAFFSLIYGPPWDDVYTGNQDHAVSLYPGAWGRTLSTRNMEAVREANQRWRASKMQ